MEVAGEAPKPLQPVYQWSDSVVDKITAVATEIYGAREVVLTGTAKADLKDIERLGLTTCPSASPRPSPPSPTTPSCAAGPRTLR